MDICGGMINHKLTFKDFEAHAIFLLTTNGKIHCPNCGWLYDGNAQCDCWKYSDMETDDDEEDITETDKMLH